MNIFDKDYGKRFDEISLCMRQCTMLRKEVEKLNGEIWRLAHILEKQMVKDNVIKDVDEE